MNLLPIYTQGKIQDGSYIHVVPFCEKNCSSKKCQEYYEKIKNQDGFHCCPYGFSSYVNVNNDRIFTGFREKSSYCKKTNRGICSEIIVYNPVLGKNQIMDLIHSSFDFNNEIKSIQEKQALLNSISHEAKKLNAQIKERCDAVLSKMPNDESDNEVLDISELQSAFKTIYVSASMVDSRFSLLDYEKNPETLKAGRTFDCNVYKKFHKIQRVFKNYQKKNIYIEISGESYATIDAYPTFELIPLLIIENAIKYAYGSNDKIKISFINKNCELDVLVTSYSPYCSSEEIAHIFDKGFRGKHAQRVSSDGSGIGLYFVKLLCDLHGIDISVISESANISEINGIPYSKFIVTLHFPNVKYTSI